MRRTALVSFLCSAMIPCANAAITLPAGITDSLRAPSDQTASLVLSAEGVQIYNCKQSPDNPDKYRWAFVAPEATLKDNGATVGRHGSGPSWESTTDRSSVSGLIRNSQDGGSGNIPWLLIAAKSNDSTGMFAGVVTIQRVATHGGVAPQDPCNASNVGQEARVPYTADYYFYKKG